jgi:hypothetical protein
MIIDRLLPNPMGGFFIQRSCSGGGMVYTRDLKSLGLTTLRVRVSPGALVIKGVYNGKK